MRELDEKTREAIAENVRTRRTVLGKSQRDLAGQAGLSEVSISNIENKTRSYIRPSTMRKLAMALGTTVPELYGVQEGDEGFLAASPSTSPEGLRWLDERAGWEHFRPPGAWIGEIADAGFDGLGEKAARLFEELGRGRRELKALRLEIEESGARSRHPDRKAWAKDLTDDLGRILEREHRVRKKTLEAVRDALVRQELDWLPEPRVFEIYEKVQAK